MKNYSISINNKLTFDHIKEKCVEVTDYHKAVYIIACSLTKDTGFPIDLIWEKVYDFLINIERATDAQDPYFGWGLNYPKELLEQARTYQLHKIKEKQKEENI